jgi:hypothetical protein
MGTPSVRASASATRPSPPRNLPSTRRWVSTGMVMRISSVPSFCSSLHSRMVSAATRKMRRMGSHENSGRMSAMLRVKKASTQKKVNNVTNRNVARKISATGERK